MVFGKCGTTDTMRLGMVLGKRGTTDTMRPDMVLGKRRTTDTIGTCGRDVPGRRTPNDLRRNFLGRYGLTIVRRPGRGRPSKRRSDGRLE